MKHIHVNFLSLLGLAITTVIMLFFGYWIFYPSQILEIKDPDNVKVEKTVYHPGDRVVYSFEYCKSRKSVATVYRALVDTYRITYVPIKSDLGVGCQKMTRNDLVIPDFVVADGKEYYIEATVEYQVNPLKKQIYYWKTEKFIIN